MHLAGCGFDSANERREAINGDLSHWLRVWFSAFEFESRQRYGIYYGASSHND